MEYSGILEYQIRTKSIVFWCTGLDEDDRHDKNSSAVGEQFNHFLLELSEDKKVFFSWVPIVWGRGKGD